MTQTIETSAQIRPAWLYSADIQDKARAAREECERLASRIRSRLAVRRAQMEAAEEAEFTPDVEPVRRKFTPGQLEAGFANYPEPKARPGPQPQRLASKAGERRRAGRYVMGSERRK